MEVAAQSFYQSKLLISCSSSSLPSVVGSNKSSSCLLPSNCFVSFESSKTRSILRIKSKKRTKAKVGVVCASGSDEVQISPATDVVAETWLLQPVGDGDTKHIGFKVELPSAFEIASNVVTVGRLPEKADIVIPVATVSGLHARIEKKGGSLLVTDLDSTNGTFIDEQRLRPGVAATASSGACITFGDTHLAMFLVSKLEKEVDAPIQPAGEESSTPATDNIPAT